MVDIYAQSYVGVVTSLCNVLEGNIWISCKHLEETLDIDLGDNVAEFETGTSVYDDILTGKGLDDLDYSWHSKID